MSQISIYFLDKFFWVKTIKWTADKSKMKNKIKRKQKIKLKMFLNLKLKAITA